MKQEQMHDTGGPEQGEDLLTHIVVNFLLRRDNKFLLERVKGGQPKIPGGHVEPGESPLDAVRRETLEEYGVEVVFPDHEKLFPDDDIAKSLPLPIASYAHTVERDGSLDAPHVNFVYAYVAEPVGEPRPQEGQEISWVGVEGVPSIQNPYVRRIVEAAFSAQVEYAAPSQRTF